MDEIHITLKHRTLERAIFIIIILVLVVLLVLRTVNTPEGTAATTTTMAAVTTTGAVATTATQAGATTTVQTGGASTTTVKATTTTTTTLLEGIGVKILEPIYEKLNATVWGESYAASHRKLKGVKLQVTNNYLINNNPVDDLELRAKVYFWDSADDEESKNLVKATLTLPVILFGDTINYTGNVTVIFANLNLEKTLKVDIIPRLGGGEEVLKTATYKFKAK